MHNRAFSACLQGRRKQLNSVRANRLSIFVPVLFSTLAKSERAMAHPAHPLPASGTPAALHMSQRTIVCGRRYRLYSAVFYAGQAIIVSNKVLHIQPAIAKPNDNHHCMHAMYIRVSKQLQNSLIPALIFDPDFGLL